MSFSFNLKSTHFKSPLLVASGTFGYGDEVSELVNINELGGIITKSVTLHAREGNPPPRIAETPCGMLNSIGLANVGVDRFLSDKLPPLTKLALPVIVNIAGSTFDEYAVTMDRIEASGLEFAGYEINISCPNVKEGGMAFGVDPEVTANLTKLLRKKTSRLLIMKLSPNVTRIDDIAIAAESQGADAVSAINTVVGMGIDIQSRRPRLHTITGGLSGAAIKPIALANVYKVSKAVRIPIIGIGGITNASDVVEFFLAGADLVQLGTINFSQPAAGLQIRENLEKFCAENGIKNLHDLKGQLRS